MFNLRLLSCGGASGVGVGRHEGLSSAWSSMAIPQLLRWSSSHPSSLLLGSCVLVLRRSCSGNLLQRFGSLCFEVVASSIVTGPAFEIKKTPCPGSR
ncbi:hypothetical protein N665_0740s0004 [Sinapis alba]|nr:hypothetical protein N665_0740s0004 [Sinapis alba]